MNETISLLLMTLFCWLCATVASESVDKIPYQLGPEAKASLSKGVPHDID